MSDETKVEHPNGAVQAICTGAIGDLAILIAFIGYTTFNTKSAEVPWSLKDLPYLLVAFFAIFQLALVPWEATRMEYTNSINLSLEKARYKFLLGSMATITSIAFFFVKEFWQLFEQYINTIK